MSTEFSPSGNIKKTLEIAGFSAKKSLGQNFLHDANIIRKIAEVSNVSKKDVVLEIGPGFGTITEILAINSKKLIAVEMDRKIANWLINSLNEKGIDNVEIIISDAIKELKDSNSELFCKLPKKYKVVANIPYYLTSHLIRLLLENENPPESITLMIQKEVAERICSKNINSLLSISINYYANPKINFFVSKNCFHPKPKIDSAVISLIPKRNLHDKQFTKTFFKLLKAGFSSPRKQLLKNLIQIGERDKIKQILESSNLDATQRAETLSLDDWIRLTKTYLESE
ncbi:MAG: 16S rRNA (adenine(1518)-N(6)/adenine(1519)-N(6))-dimethyltransferase RsmA [Candidatus Paceibacterota bacterium]|jgi:16S rRNA (adenine1518-N6/adenine1519-N6)-dimethyltransferase|nr:16S rRNA (adenine(1518)-N(6)/adenine(1519)-N(6))-dimethyltransferase RsmA [bacterium]